MLGSSGIACCDPHCGVLVLAGHGFIWTEQLHLRGMTGSGLRLGLALALFSFVGLRAPPAGVKRAILLKTIPRAVIQSRLSRESSSPFRHIRSARLSHCGQDLGTSQAPCMCWPWCSCAGVWIADRYRRARKPVRRNSGCITAAARVLLLMAHNGLAQRSLRATHIRHETPIRSVIVTARRLSSLWRYWRRAAPVAWTYMDGWLARDYGFIVAYALVCLALPRYLRDHGVFRPWLA